MKIIHRIALLLVLFSKNLPGFTQDTLTVRFDKLMSAEIKEGDPGGAILVAKEGRIIYHKAFGTANVELNVPMQKDMVFYIGSNTKQFTAVSVLQLVEKSKLSLDDRLEKYVSCASPACGITIAQLLSHTSGLSSNTNTPEYKLINRKEGKRSEIAAYYASQTTEFLPGSKWSYNNANYDVLGYIIEKLTGKTYEEYISENLFRPAGMKNSYLANDTRLIKNRASGYFRGRQGLANVPLSNTHNFYASGGILSTVADLFHWNRALKTGMLLKNETLSKSFIPQVLSDGTHTAYGFGWRLEELRGSPVYRHGGAVPGFISETMYLPNEDVYVALLLNVESGMQNTALTRIMASEVIGKTYRFVETPVDSISLKKYAGLYINDHDELINMTTSAGMLYFQRPGGVRYQVKPSSNDAFFFEKGYLWLEFARDGTNGIKSLEFSRVGIAPMKWKKTDRPPLRLYPDKVPENVLDRYCGVYSTSDGDSLAIKREGGGLVLEQEAKEKVSLIANSLSIFSPLNKNLTVEFQSGDGKTTSLSWIEDGRKRLANKVK